MLLAELLAKRKKNILDRCMNLLLDTYPRDSVTLLGDQQDPFVNPVGSTFRQAFEAIVDGLVASTNVESLFPAVDAIVRIRAVQEFRPSEALVFGTHLKKAIREEVQEQKLDEQALHDLTGLESRIDELTLVSFDVYVACREKITEIRVGEARAERDRLVRLMQAMTRMGGKSK